MPGGRVPSACRATCGTATETWGEAFFNRDSLMLWLVTTHRAHRRRHLERLDRFEFVRLGSQREIEAWLVSGTGG